VCPNLPGGALTALPEVAWELDAGAPALIVGHDYETVVQLELIAVLGGLRWSWTQEAYVDEGTSITLAIDIPDALRLHEDAVGVPFSVGGLARTEHQTVPVEVFWGVLDEQRRTTRTERPRVRPWVESLYPPNPQRRHRGAVVDPDADDTGIARGEP
jgi:hypothetical protein